MILAVLAGDFIGSADWPEGAVARAHALLAAEAARIATWAGGPTRYTRNRGDGWQIVIARPAFDLRAALVLRAVLRAEGKAFSTRIALARGVGEVAGDDLNRARGPVFIAAGRGLDTMHGEITLDHMSAGALGAAALLADRISAGWTPAQARAIAPMLAPDPPTHAEVAASIGISRSAVSQALAAAHHDAFARALARIEAEAQETGDSATGDSAAPAS